MSEFTPLRAVVYDGGNGTEHTEIQTTGTLAIMTVARMSNMHPHMESYSKLFVDAPELCQLTRDWLSDIDKMLAESPRHEVAPHVREMADRARAVLARIDEAE